MTHVLSVHRIAVGAGHFVEHAAAVVLGLIMMVVGLALGVTMIMLPVGIVIGLLGMGVFIAGLFAHIDGTER